jgi:hypothetical protein
LKKHLNKDGQPFFNKRKGARAAVRSKARPTASPKLAQGERLDVCAIRHASGEISHGFQSHYALRSSLGYADASQFKLGDVPGFLTSRGRFVTRAEAVPVGVASGQLVKEWLTVRRELLSSDIDWERGAR